MEWVALAGGAIAVAILVWWYDRRSARESLRWRRNVLYHVEHHIHEVNVLLKARRLALEARSRQPRPTDTTLN